MTTAEIIQFIASLPGVEVVTASEANGAPEVSWGDSFFFYDPDGNDKRFPFATIVTKNYGGFDTASSLDRAGVFRLNVAVDHAKFEELAGYPPAEHAGHQADFDYTALDRVLPHPIYARQAWVSILNPGERTSGQARSLIIEAHARAATRHRPHR